MSDSVEHVTDTDFESQVLKSDVPVLVDFWAPWCGPCLMLTPVMEAIAEDRGEKIKVVKVNVDESQGVAMQMGIRSIPTVMVFNGGELKEMVVGARPRGDFEQMVDRALSEGHTETATAEAQAN